jgi:hypothetical protein
LEKSFRTWARDFSIALLWRHPELAGHPEKSTQDPIHVSSSKSPTDFPLQPEKQFDEGFASQVSPPLKVERNSAPFLFKPQEGN